MIIQAHDLVKVFHVGETEVRALDGVSMSVIQGEMIAIMGPSGSGKSTLMNVLGCLMTADTGSYTLDGKDVSSLTSDNLAAARNQMIGFVFQSFNLLPRLTALENVELPLTYGRFANPRLRAIEALERVGLKDRMHHEPSQLSGGQRQRVAIARALVNHPSILLADEPTGALDSRTGEEILDLFRELNNEGRTIVVVTHDSHVGEKCGRIVRIMDGRILEDKA
ncbi:MAG: macrolide ABC transporter ATP-binding protein [Candidatus Wallbacteria bacterium HGW-Wallbacteria-1]|uniref:Macrolide ABC transporter ATP-binding protein n=1 Tax=Candidatus Wallbacteria bacterium HGW-Wallbacteria-1 TaxID=2013854 RepID=A0A2N1PRC7_9BACT|nr:MAG: macrolide ABC transporter ATP-binding protein [Candidatus Wallbacteria bacterium HGW-Wallbacteria-1]